MISQAAVIHVGTPPPDYNDGWVTRTVHVDGFESLSAERGVDVSSPEFEGVGNQWCVRIFPGGTAAEGMVDLFLFNMSGKAIEIYYGVSFNDGNGNLYKRTNTSCNFVRDQSYGWIENFAKRSLLLSSCIDGTLVIEVHMKLTKPAASSPLPFIPENPFGKRMQRLFLNDKSADILFEVGGEEESKDNAMTVAKTAPVAFTAHRLIVEDCSSIFAELCESNDDDRTTPIQITGVSPDVFRLLLSYMYGMKISNDDMKSHAKELVDVADRYGVVNLKLEAEASFVVGTIFSVDNVMELLIYAESKNCALLKEAVMDYFVENHADVIEKLRTNALIPGSLIKDVLETVFRGEKKDRISELRKKAHEKGLDVDG